MGINDEYSRDAYLGDHYAYDSDESDDHEIELDEESWQDWYSEEILDAWMTLRGHLDENYIQTSAKYPEFVELVLNSGQWYTAEDPSQDLMALWNIVSSFSIVKERVLPQNFWAWAKQYIDLY